MSKETERLFLTVAAVALIASCDAVNKCCRAGDVVQVESFEGGNLSPGRQFSCVNPLRIVNTREDAEVSNDLTNSNKMIAYNILIDENPHWPACSDGSNLEKSVFNESAKLSESASCVDIMDGLYLIFSCVEALETAEDLKDLNKLRKCCKENHSFDVFERRCVRNNNSNLNEDFGSFLGAHVVVFELGLPQCKSDEVLVEYHSLVHKLDFLESLLIINQATSHGQDVVLSDAYCIESTLNSAVSVPEGANPAQYKLKATSKWIAKACRPRAVCDRMPCVQKCCEEDQRLVMEDNATYCDVHDSHLSLKFHKFKMPESGKRPSSMEPTEFGLLKYVGCELSPLGESDGEYFYSAIDGSLYLPKTDDFYPNEDYCIEYLETITDQAVSEVKAVTYVCLNARNIKNKRFRIYATILAISAAFLALTIVVYILLPKLLNLHGKILMCYVLSLCAAYSFLSAAQFSTDTLMANCKIVALVIYFSFLSAFCWLNVMCIDIFRTFGSTRMMQETRKMKELKRLICYSIYAWGLPCLAVILCLMIDSHNLLPQKYSPNIGKNSCWFEHVSAGHVIFFLVPVGLQLSINIVLFVITAIHCNRVKAEIHRMQMDDNFEKKKKPFLAHKAILLTNLKLFIVMGVPWLLEILATIFHEGPMLSLFVFSDILNALQGVFIFFIFVFKRRVLKAFQQKFGIRSRILRPNKGDSAASSNFTSSGFSRSSKMQNTRISMSSR